MEIRKIAVLGSGVMGAGIAALAANAGCEVMLMDIVPPGEANRNALAEKGIEKQLKSGGFTHPDNAKRVMAANLEDHIGLLKDVDWIAEAVLEKIEVKQAVYEKLAKFKKKGAVVSSNTSTLRLMDLVSGMHDAFRKDFMIAHFFNPPRHMRLLEVVGGEYTSKEALDAVKNFADVSLGKQVVVCKDTPGFIANRIGVYWMVVALTEAIRLNVTVEQADAVMSKPAGIPKTGVFGLYDLIGIDLIPLIAKAMLDTLATGDAFRQLWQEPELMTRMIQAGYTGRKGKGGFYRVTKQGERKIKEVIEFTTGHYRQEGAVDLPSAKAKNVKELVNSADLGGQYAWAVLSKTLTYAASLIPEIADDIYSVDAAMKTGYSWKYGPFELIDIIGVDAFSERIRKNDIAIPRILSQAKGKSFYTNAGGHHRQVQLDGTYAEVPHTVGHLWLADKKLGAHPVTNNASASLWDLGDGIACLELTSKMNAIDANILAFIEQIIPRVKQNFKGLVIGNDSEQFCVGANLKVFLEHAKAEEWNAISDIITRGQAAMMSLKYAPFPVVASLAGLALGGGCELAMHAQGICAHMEAHPGLVEPNVGLIPGWGGCKELLLRHGEALPAFEMIATAKTAGSADEAREMKILGKNDSIIMNRARMLAEAKVRCMQMGKGFKPGKPAEIKAGGTAAKQAMLDKLSAMEGAAPHDLVVGRVLAYVLSAGEAKGAVTEQRLLELEHEGFMELIRTTATQARIEHMLNTGKPLKN